MENFTAWVADNPIASFTILLFASVTVPPLIERLKLPGLVGLLLAGVALGPHGLGLLSPDSETIKLLSDIGKIYLMFVAGLEIDMRAFRRTRNRSLSFGVATFLIPLTTGTLLGLAFGFGLNASILIGSLLASHTLLAYPLVQRLGIARNEAITVTVGATIFTDIGALLVLAVCVSIHQGEFSWFSLPIQLGSLAIYSAAVLYGLDWLGKEYFRRTGNEEGNQFLFILLALFLASVGAQVIHIENIVGAFLAGLAVNDVLGRGAVKEKVEFVGGVLFIPFFFVAMGLLINIPVFIQTLGSDFALVAAIVVGLIGSKFLAAFVIKAVHHYSWTEAMTMGSLSLPQVAATLAATLVGFQVGLLTEEVFNSVIVLMLVTSVLGPVLTQRFASQLPLPERDGGLEPKQVARLEDYPTVQPNPAMTVMVPVYNPATEPHLIEMAALLVQSCHGRVMPLAIAHPSSALNDPEFSVVLRRTRSVLKHAVESTLAQGVHVHPILRIDQDVALGISYAAREQDADLVLMGYGDITTLQARLLGNVIDQVFRTSPCSVAVMRLLTSPSALTRILVPVWDILPHTLHLISFAQSLATANHGTVTVMYLVDPSTSENRQEDIRHHLSEQIGLSAKADTDPDHPLAQVKIKAIATSDIRTAILRTAQHADLVILNAMDVHPAKGLITSDWATSIIQKLNCSMVLFSPADG
ncbi:MAG: cation:proton antiporter [Leptolyngbyaceae bacterium]|nr:cation:proton antiporter [Leptolyngbyaceae bacterium]